MFNFAAAFVPEIRVSHALNPNFDGVYKINGVREGFPSYAAVPGEKNSGRAFIYAGRMKDGTLHWLFDEDQVT